MSMIKRRAGTTGTVKRSRASESGMVLQTRRGRVDARWSRNEWLNKLEEALVRAALPFYMAQLEVRHGQLTRSLPWMIECRSTLAFAASQLLTLPLKREFDKRDAFSRAVREMQSWRAPGRQHAQSLYDRAHGPLLHLLEERDTQEFFAYAVQSFERLLLAHSADRSHSAVKRRRARRRAR